MRRVVDLEDAVAAGLDPAGDGFRRARHKAAAFDGQGRLIVGDQLRPFIDQSQREVRLAGTGRPRQQHADLTDRHTGGVHQASLHGRRPSSRAAGAPGTVRRR